MSNAEYKTRDLAMAGFLLCNGYEPLRCEKLDGDNRAVMVFDLEEDDLMDKVDLFHAGEARVEPVIYQRKIAIAREQLREAAESNHGH